MNDSRFLVQGRWYNRRLRAGSRGWAIFAVFLTILNAVSLTACGQENAAQQENNANARVIDERLPKYEAVENLPSESLRLVGSGTMRAIVTKWGREYQKLYPSVFFEVDKKGSGNAIPALIQGQASFGLMSRPPKKTEIAAFKDRFGYPPDLIACCIDMLAVYVHRDNPIPGLTFQELDAIFSSSRRRGATARVLSWDQFGPSENAEMDSPIQCFGRNSASGTYAYFKKYVLKNGDYGNWVAEMVGSSNVTQVVGANVQGIGYSGIGFNNPMVRALPLGQRGANGNSLDEFVSPTFANAYSGSYPLSRYLYLVVNNDPRSRLSDVQIEFLKFVSSKPGQQVVLDAGLVPLRKPLRDQQFGPILGEGEDRRSAEMSAPSTNFQGDESS